MPQSPLHDYWSELQEEDWSGSLVMLVSEQYDVQVLFDKDGTYLGRVLELEDETVVNVYAGYRGPARYKLTVAGPYEQRVLIASQIIVVDVTKMLEDGEKIRDVLKDGR